MFFLASFVLKLHLPAGPRCHDDRRFAKQLLTDLDDDGQRLVLVVVVEDVEVVVSSSGEGDRAILVWLS